MDSSPFFTVNDPIFDDLKSSKPTVASTLQPLVPALVQLFNSMQTKLINEVRTIMHDTVETIKHDCLTEYRAQNQKIQALEKQICHLEEKLYATEAYERRDTVIISGSVPGAVNSEDTSNLVVDLIRKNFQLLKSKDLA